MDNKSHNLQYVQAELINDINKRVTDKILEETNAKLLIKLINKAESIAEAIAIAELGTTYKRTGFHFDKRLEIIGSDIKYFNKNHSLSFINNKDKLTHKLIIGDNYDALLNLLISHKNMIDVIYIDPPYGKNDMGQFAETNYKNDITRDNLLSMLYPRLQLAKQLLQEDGIIFCSIDDKNQTYVKGLFDEIFGESNFVANLVVNSAPAGSQSSQYVAVQQSYCLMYRKSTMLKVKNIDLDAETLENKYSKGIENGERYYTERIWKRGVGGRKEDVPSLHFPVYYDKVNEYIYIDDEIDNLPNDLKENLITIIPYHTKGVLGRWTWGKETMKNNKDSLIVKQTSGEYKLYKKVWASQENGTKLKTIIESDIGRTELGSLEIKEIMGYKAFLYPKSSLFIKTLIGLHPKKDAIVLDFFAGSGTTGHAVMKLNEQDGGTRTFICCTNNETTDVNPNGIAYDVTSKRLKRIMSGACYDCSKDYNWIKLNNAYLDNLDVYDIKYVNNAEQSNGKTPFDVIDETLYGVSKFNAITEKIQWVCANFDNTQKYLHDTTNNYI